MIIVEIIICIITGYLLGSISFGYIMGKETGVDIRSEGSGNIGATNAIRTMGVKAGIITFLGDFFKAFIPTFLAGYISEKYLGNSADLSYIIGLITGVAATLGHNFPFWMGFKGGKGIAVTAGVTVAIAFYHPIFILIAVVLFVIIVLITRYVSLGSLLVPAWAPFAYTLIFKRDNEYLVYAIIISLLFTALAFIKHAPNIKRLLNGTENKLFGKKKDGGQSNEN